MTLDARVYCNCLELQALRTQPLPEWQVYVTEEGGRGTKATDLETQLAFDRWNNYDACPHEAGVLLRDDLGNIARVAFLREVLDKTPDRFSILLGRVVYSGTHSGDFLAVEVVQRLRPELDQLTLIHATNSDDERVLRSFEQQMRRLVECSLQLGKPIAF